MQAEVAASQLVELFFGFTQADAKGLRWRIAVATGLPVAVATAATADGLLNLMQLRSQSRLVAHFQTTLPRQALRFLQVAPSHLFECFPLHMILLCLPFGTGLRLACLLELQLQASQARTQGLHQSDRKSVV